jgi:hypothetical protein
MGGEHSEERDRSRNIKADDAAEAARQSTTAFTQGLRSIKARRH